MNNDDKANQLENDINFVLSGTGCSNLFELRTAFDSMRTYLYCKHNELWDHKKIANTVCKAMYDQCICDENESYKHKCKGVQQ